MPGSPQGIPDWAPTIADLLKVQGCASGQFGRNHLGDRDSHLPTVHGFDEFLGNLYHLHAEEEPETCYYSKDPEFRKKFGPRGVLQTLTTLSESPFQQGGSLNAAGINDNALQALQAMKRPKECETLVPGRN
jgi:arylsulfatase A-like enzyme